MPRPWDIGSAFGKIEWPLNFCSSTLAVVLLGLMSAIQARVCIEIGVYTGFTTRVFAHGLSALGGGTLISCEPYACYCEEARKFLSTMPDIKSRVIQDYSNRVDWAAQLADMGQKEACVALVDGDHSYEGAKADIEKVSTIIRPNGLLACHDYHPRFPGVIQAADEFQKSSGWQRIYLPEQSEVNNVSAVIFQRGA